MPDVYLGTILMVGFNFAPQGWALCNGQLLSIAQNTALFSLLGTTYGGNGTTNFALPDLQGRVPIHMGNGAGLSPYVIGQNGGVEGVTLLASQMPQHLHTVATPCSTANATATSPASAYPAVTVVDAGRGVAPTPSYASAPTAGQAMAPVNTSLVGGNLPHPNIQPYLTVNFIIALQGIFPTRS
jgi:microcystin-dependent protein